MSVTMWPPRRSRMSARLDSKVARTTSTQLLLRNRTVHSFFTAMVGTLDDWPVFREEGCPPGQSVVPTSLSTRSILLRIASQYHRLRTALRHAQLSGTGF